MEKELIIRGRLLSASDISFVRFLVKKHWHKGRTFISLGIMPSLELGTAKWFLKRDGLPGASPAIGS